MGQSTVQALFSDGRRHVTATRGRFLTCCLITPRRSAIPRPRVSQVMESMAVAGIDALFHGSVLGSVRSLLGERDLLEGTGRRKQNTVTTYLTLIAWRSRSAAECSS